MHRPSWLVDVALRNPNFALHQLARRYGRPICGRRTCSPTAESRTRRRGVRLHAEFGRATPVVPTLPGRLVFSDTHWSKYALRASTFRSRKPVRRTARAAGRNSRTGAWPVWSRKASQPPFRMALLAHRKVPGSAHNGCDGTAGGRRSGSGGGASTMGFGPRRCRESLRPAARSAPQLDELESRAADLHIPDLYRQVLLRCQ